MSENGQLWFSTQTNGFPLSTRYLILGVFGQNLSFDLVVGVADFLKVLLELYLDVDQQTL
jgi:hypothetical protein